MEARMMTEPEKRLRRCCFTGHRPEKLGCTERAAAYALEATIREAYASGYRTFLTGMARGVDIWAAEIVLREREAHPDIHLICALPHPDFQARWALHWQKRYEAILADADLVKTICPSYCIGAYQRRNEWLVDHSSLVIAFFTGQPGGTANTIAYARKQGVSVHVIGGENARCVEYLC